MDAEMDLIDLDANREARAAQREGKRKDLPVRFGGELIATLPVELPLDVLSPLRRIDSDLALLLRTAIDGATSDQAQSRMAATGLVIDLLASNPNLPGTVMDVITDVARGVLTDEGYDRLVAQRPTKDDVVYLAKSIFRFYGVSLGESSASSPLSSTGGETSSTTSPPISDSTPEGFGDAAPSKAS